MAAFRGMHVSPAKHRFEKCDRQTDRRMDKVIHMCRYASQATQKCYYHKIQQNSDQN